MTGATTRDVVVALLGIGGGTFLWTMARSYLAIRDSAEGREDKAVERLERFEHDCREQLRAEREWGAYCFRVAGIYRYALNAGGIPEPSLPPEPSTRLQGGPVGPPPPERCEDC